MDVLIVGGAGYIGSMLCRHFLNAGYGVRCLDALVYENGKSIADLASNPKFKFIEGDFCDADTAAQALREVRHVVVLAGLVGDPITKKYPEASEAINYSGMKVFLQNLNGKKIDKVVFVSTCSNYGLIQGDQLADEDFELNPLSTYAKAKVSMEKELLSMKGRVDFSPVILRFATAFGLSERMRFDLTVSEFTKELYLGKKLLVYDADTWRPYCHVQDFCSLIQKAIEAPKEKVAFDVFNAGGEMNNFTKRMIVEAILKQLPKGEVEYRSHGSDPRNYRVNFQKIKSRLGFTPRFSVADGIAELVDAFKNGSFADCEQNRNFYGNYVVNYPRAFEMAQKK